MINWPRIGLTVTSIIVGWFVLGQLFNLGIVFVQ